MKNRESLSAFYSDPQIRHLLQVLEEFHRGQLLVPKFHRPLVWPKDMRIALLDSILRGIPIGSITVWRTRSVDVAVQDRFGPFLLPKPDEMSPVHQYLIDGEQRIATLYSALFDAMPVVDGQADVDETPDEFRIFYDLCQEQFLTRSDLKEVLPYHLSLTDLLDGPRLTRFQRRLSGSSLATTSSIDSLIDLSDEIADAFRQYKFPLIPVTSEDLALLTETFRRVNSQGVPMSEVHMVNALTWSTEFDLFKRFQAMRDGSLADYGWDELEDQTILRVCKVTLAVPAYDNNAGFVSHMLKGNPGILDEVEEQLYNTAAFLRSECGIRAPELVPYTAQIVLLAAAFQRTPGPSAEVRANLRNWLWLTTYTEAFQRQMSESRFSQFLEEVRMLADGERPPPPQGRLPTRRQLPRFDFRHSRARGLALLLAEHKPHDPSTGAPKDTDGFDLLAEYRVRAVPQLVIASMAKDVSSSPGARVLVRPESIGPLRETLRSSLVPPSDEFLKSHVIREEAYRAFRDGDYATFVKLREEDLNRLEEQKFQAVLATLYPQGESIDTPPPTEHGRAP